MKSDSVSIPESIPQFHIGNRSIGPGNPVYIISELSANHDQCFEKAVELVHASAECGVDAVKLQTYTAETLTLDCDNDCFKIQQGTVWDGLRLFDLYKQAFTPWEWQPKLKRIANDLGIELFSSPFDTTSVEFLERMDVPVYKIASFEIVDIPLLRHVARTKKPVIVSTGMAEIDEIELALETLTTHGTPSVALLKCTSAYPADPKSMNLRTIADLAKRFNVVTGLSDHTLGNEASIASVCLGGSIIEKHLTLDRADGGPDSKFSLEPQELKSLVDSIRKTEQAIGTVHYGPTEFDRKNLHFRRSLFVVRDIKEGELFTADNIRSIRPANGLPPKEYDNVIGSRASQRLVRGTPLKSDHIELTI